MAAAADIDTEDLEITIKGLLISRPTVVKANVLQRECEEELGKAFPFRRLGFQSFVDYLRSIPAIVQLEPHHSPNPDVYPVASRASSHIDQLVSRQRVAPTKRRGVARRGAYNSRPAAVRRRPTRPVVSRPAPPVVRPNQGIDVRALENYMSRNYDKRDLMRNGIHSVDDLLSHAEGMVERGDTKVYPKLAGGSNSTNRSSVTNGIPAGLEDDFDDFDDECEFYDEEPEQDSEEELSKQAIQLWSQALGVEENGSSPRTEMPGGESSAVNTEGERLGQNADLPEDDSNISSRMINNFRKILSQHPDGIWASQLQQLYFDQFRVSLEILDLGHTSAISLASSLPSVFTFYREGPHDWKLYDARYVPQESLDTQENGGHALLSENGRYIPQTIIDNIKKLLDENPNGFRSTDLLQLYVETFRKPLNLEILGFNTLEEFLMILKNDVTLKKVLNYYLLLPKHRLISHEALQPPKPDERLNVPAEALCVPIPENVLLLGEEIPLQELPPVEMDPDPDKPLLELEVRVAEVISPVFFYMILGSMYEELEKMMDDLEKFYLWEEAHFKIPLPHIAVNLYCAAKYENYWHRAKITRVKNHGNIEIEYIDYGTPGTTKSSELRYLSKEFAYLPAQAICAKLIGVKPTNGETKFSPEVSSEFLNLVEGKRLVAHVYHVGARVRQKQERMQLEVILFDVENPNQETVINDYLVEKGLAIPIPQIQDSSTEDQLHVGDLLPENELISIQANGPSVSLPSGSISLPENVSSSHLGNASTSLPACSKTQEENKPRRPPPGFERLPIDLDFGFTTPPVSTAPTHSSSSQTKSQPSNGLSAEEQRILIDNFFSTAPTHSSSSQTNSQPFNGLSAEEQRILINNFFSTAPTHSSSSQTNSQPSNGLSTEEQRILINNFYLMNTAQLYPSLLLQEQYHQQNVYQPNPSNMPLEGSPLFQSHQNRSQRSLTYSSVVPPQNAYRSPQSNIYRQQEYHAAPPVPSNYVQMAPTVSVPMIHPAHGSFVLMNAPVPNQYFKIYQPPLQNVIGNSTVNLQGYGQGDFMLVPPPVQAARHQPSPIPTRSTPTPPPTTPRPVSSSAPSYTPVTVPEWPLPTDLPACITSAPTETKVVSCPHHSVPASPKKSEFPEVNQITRPCTPLTPASAEVANICKLGITNSSASHNSGRQLANSLNNSSPLDNTSSKSQNNTSPINNNSSKTQNNTSPLDNTSSKSQNNISPLDKTSSKSQNNISPLGEASSKSQNNPSPLDNILSKSQNNANPLDNISRSNSQICESNLDSMSINSQINKSSMENSMSILQIEKIEHDSRNNLNLSFDTKVNPQPHTEMSEIPLPPDIDLKKIPLPPPSPEKLYSAISSPVDSLFCTSPLKEESSDDYASASEHIEEVTQQLFNLTLTEQFSTPALKSSCDTIEDIPDSWENLDLDDTPAKAANFSVDFSQPLDLIIKNIESESTKKANNPVEKPVSLEVKRQESPFKIQAPVNWKDVFNPDIISSSEKVDNNNKVKVKSPSPIKFNVKKVPVQVIEVQGKHFHLLSINDTPAVVALEFFKQFSSTNNPTVSEKVVEVSHNKMYYISKAEYPAILSELNKVTEFWGGLQKKVVIRVNKVRVLNLSDIPQCLKVLNVPNKPLLEDLKKIANELQTT